MEAKPIIFYFLKYRILFQIHYRAFCWLKHVQFDDIWSHPHNVSFGEFGKAKCQHLFLWKQSPLTQAITISEEAWLGYHPSPSIILFLEIKSRPPRYPHSINPTSGYLTTRHSEELTCALDPEAFAR